MMPIPYNKPFITGQEFENIKQAIARRHLSGNGYFTNLCHIFFQEKYGFGKCLLTTSCTDALEMAAILCGIQPEDEIIMPSFTFVSTANAFVLRGAKIVFADSSADHPNIDETRLPELLSPKTKPIVVVHYAGMSCNMEAIINFARLNNLIVIEDAAQAVDNFYIDKNGVKKPIGTFGHFAAFSFHESKNIQCAEGGMLVVNDKAFYDRAEIIWEKGTNRAAFFRGEVDKYSWVDVGSSFLPSEITAAFLFAQLSSLQNIQDKRKLLWDIYFKELKALEEQFKIQIPRQPLHSDNNAHIFYIVCKSIEERTALMLFLKTRLIESMFHYVSLHTSSFYLSYNKNIKLPNAERFSDCLLRLPLFPDLSETDVILIASKVKQFYE
ncbi:MAG: dTDP-4-amino-4,6-dideoxygalactose transaminase [Ginsengibacter sp.]